ncbi:MAG: hypothetical protein KAS17_12885, partial [Victivallaceae bacterium]|nr:hypothetical protein [Victivallaceae bacterium]
SVNVKTYFVKKLFPSFLLLQQFSASQSTSSAPLLKISLIFILLSSFYHYPFKILINKNPAKTVKIKIIKIPNKVIKFSVILFSCKACFAKVYIQFLNPQILVKIHFIL